MIKFLLGVIFGIVLMCVVSVCKYDYDYNKKYGEYPTFDEEYDFK